MRIEDVRITIVEIPQIEPIAPYRSHVRTSSTTCSAIVELCCDHGLVGWGEFNVNFLPGTTAGPMQEQARDFLVGWDPRDVEVFAQRCPFENRLKSGLEIAMWDAAGKSAGLPVARLLGGILRPEIELAACMGIQTYERAGEIARWYVEQGYTTLKTKAGANAEEDLEMVRGVRDAVGDRLQLRIDPNRAYSPQQAAELARQLEPYQLQYFEQPIMAEPLADAVWLRQQTRTPLALNESVIDPPSVWEILRLDAAEFILPDTHIAGGIGPCRKIGELGAAAGVPCIMHCGHDLGPKTATMVHVAAACEAYSLANDSTYYGLVEDITVRPLVIEKGRIRVPETPGLGVEGDPEKIRKYAVDAVSQA